MLEGAAGFSGPRTALARSRRVRSVLTSASGVTYIPMDPDGEITRSTESSAAVMFSSRRIRQGLSMDFRVARMKRRV
jgi:hypothetical protein